MDKKTVVVSSLISALIVSNASYVALATGMEKDLLVSVAETSNIQN